MTTRKIWRAERVVLPDGERPAAIAVEDGKVVGILEKDAPWEADEEVLVPDGQALMPGLIDIHVHVNEPGRTEWEGYETATRAAAAGGFTTLVDMPLNSSPCTTSLENLELKKGAARGKLSMDVGFWGGVIPGNIEELRPMWEAGVFGFKCFLGDSGLDEYPYVDRPTLLAAMKEIASFGGLLIIHAEDASILNSAPGCDGRSYEAFMNSHPAEAENASIDFVVEAVRQTGCRAHILHLGSAGAVDSIRRAKAEALPITVETAPHYLTFDAEEIPDGATEYKCCPPLRGHDNRMGLWKALQEGVIDLVASDHSPSTAELKHLDTGDFGAAWGGISSVHPRCGRKGASLGRASATSLGGRARTRRRPSASRAKAPSRSERPPTLSRWPRMRLSSSTKTSFSTRTLCPLTTEGSSRASSRRRGWRASPSSPTAPRAGAKSRVTTSKHQAIFH